MDKKDLIIELQKKLRKARRLEAVQIDKFIKRIENGTYDDQILLHAKLRKMGFKDLAERFVGRKINK